MQGEYCVETTDCADGLLCFDTRCTAFCCPSTNEPCAGMLCSIAISFDDEGLAYLCAPEGGCTLFQDECPDGYDCHISDMNGGITQCDQPSSNPSPEGGPCQFRNDCGESQYCNSSPPDDGICRHLCDPSDWESSQPSLGGGVPDRTCVDVNLPAFPGLGICLPL